MGGACSIRSGHVLVGGMSDDSNVIPMRGLIMYQDEAPEITLEKAKAWGMKRCVVVGESPDGKLIFGMSFSDVETINWMLDLAKAQLIFDVRNRE
jgi:hypothetical protein